MDEKELIVEALKNELESHENAFHPENQETIDALRALIEKIDGKHYVESKTTLTQSESSEGVVRAQLKIIEDIHGPAVRLPDGSGVLIASGPLPKDHWLYEDKPNEPPAGLRMGTDDPRRKTYVEMVRDAAQYAVRCATINGTTKSWDPDALVQNMIVGLLGYFTPDGHSKAG